MSEVKTGFKGFDKELKCRGHQFEVGKEYKHDGDLKLCAKGFHYCENPIDVFDYYPPADSKFAEVEAEDVSDEKEGDSKRVCKILRIKAEITIKAMIEASIKFVLERVDKTKEQTVLKDSSVASNSGDSSVASNSGDSSVASNSGKEGCSVSLGIEAQAKGAVGSWLTLSEWKEIKGEWHRIDVQTVKVDGKNIEADVFYVLCGGKFKEVK